MATNDVLVIDAEYSSSDEEEDVSMDNVEVYDSFKVVSSTLINEQTNGKKTNEPTTTATTKQRRAANKAEPVEVKVNSWADFDTVEYVAGGRFNTKPVLLNNDEFFAVAQSRHIKVFSAMTGQIIQTMLHNDLIDIAVHPTNSTQLFSASRNGLIILWNVVNGEEVSRWTVNYQLSHFAISREDAQDSGTIIGCFGYVHHGVSALCHLYLSDKGKVSFHKIRGLHHISQTAAVAVSKIDSTIIAGNGIKVITWVEDQIYYSSHDKHITCVAYNEANSMVAVGDALGTLKVFYPSGATSVYHWHPVTCNYVEFSADGNFLYSVADDGNMCIWDLQSGSRNAIHLFKPLRYFTVSPNQDNAFVVTADNTIYKLDLQVSKNRDKFSIQGVNVPLKSIPSSKLRVSVDPSSNCILLNGSNVVQWYDIEKDRELKRRYIQYKALTYNPSRYSKTKPMDHVVTHIAVGRNSHFAHCEAIDEHTCLKVWERYNVTTVIDGPHNGEITSCHFNPSSENSAALITTSLDGTAKLWNKSPLGGNNHVCYAIIDFRRLKPYSSTFSPDGTVVAIAFDHVLTLWEVTSASYLQSYEFTNGRRILSAHFLDNDQVVVRTSNELFIYSLSQNYIVWNLTLPNTIHYFDFHYETKQFFATVDSTVGVVYLFSVPEDAAKTMSKTILVQLPTLATFFSSRGEIYILSDDYDIYRLASTKQKPTTKPAITSDMEIDEEKPVKSEKIKAAKKGTKEKIKIIVPVPEATLAPFDPDQGPNAWKHIFQGYSSHQLVSMKDTFSTYMDTFLLKSEENKANQKSSDEENKSANEHNWFKDSSSSSGRHSNKSVTKKDAVEVELSNDLVSKLRLVAKNL